MRTKHKKPGPQNDHTSEDYLLLKREIIYKWLCNGVTMTNIAKKLGVSRSWLFDMFKKTEWLDDLRKQAAAERYEKVHNTLFQLAVGDYITKSKHTRKTTQVDGEGNKVSSTVIEDNTIEHEGDPNMRAMSIYMRTENITNKPEDNIKINDTITPEDFEYVDVAESGEAND